MKKAIGGCSNNDYIIDDAFFEEYDMIDAVCMLTPKEFEFIHNSEQFQPKQKINWKKVIEDE